MKNDAFNPIDHAASLIESCHGDAYEALALAHLNVEFAHGDDLDYWDRVAIAVQETITRSQFSCALDTTQLQPPSEGASALGTDLGQSFRGTALDQHPSPPAATRSEQNCSLSPGKMKVVCAWCTKVMQDGPPERVSHGICPPCRYRHFGDLVGSA